MVKILLIDDDINTLRLFNYYMPSRHKVNLELASTGVGGIEKVKGNKYDIVIVDYLLESASGKDVAEEIEKLQPDAMVVMITSDENLISDSFKVVRKGNGCIQELGEIIEEYRSNRPDNMIYIPSRYKDLHDRIQRVADETIMLRQMFNNIELRS